MHHHGAGHGVPGGYGAHGNPRDFELMLGRLEDPGRARWQRPDRLVQALGLRPGQSVAEIGAGSGYFVRRLARAVGAHGRVYAVDGSATSRRSSDSTATRSSPSAPWT